MKVPHPGQSEDGPPDLRFVLKINNVHDSSKDWGHWLIALNINSNQFCGIIILNAVRHFECPEISQMGLKQVLIPVCPGPQGQRLQQAECRLQRRPGEWTLHSHQTGRTAASSNETNVMLSTAFCKRISST